MSDQWINGTQQSPEVNPYIYIWSVFEKGSKVIQGRKNNLFLTNSAGISICKNVNLRPELTANGS